MSLNLRINFPMFLRGINVGACMGTALKLSCTPIKIRVAQIWGSITIT